MIKWYKKISQNKQAKLMLIIATLILVSVGSTYAWWTASTTVEQKVTMGNLAIEADFGKETHENYEPGTYAEINGVIKNTGTIPGLVRIENDSQITFAYADDNLTAIVDPKAEAVDPRAIGISYEPEDGNYGANADVMWFTHADGHKYLLMEPGSEVNVSIQINFNGELTTNKYMDALVEAKAKLKATQVIEGAISSEFGIDASELKELPSVQRFAKGSSRLQELLSRGN